MSKEEIISQYIKESESLFPVLPEDDKQRIVSLRFVELLRLYDDNENHKEINHPGISLAIEYFNLYIRADNFQAVKPILELYIRLDSIQLIISYCDAPMSYDEVRKIYHKNVSLLSHPRNCFSHLFFFEGEKDLSNDNHLPFPWELKDEKHLRNTKELIEEELKGEIVKPKKQAVINQIENFLYGQLKRNKHIDDFYAQVILLTALKALENFSNNSAFKPVEAFSEIKNIVKLDIRNSFDFFISFITKPIFLESKILSTLFIHTLELHLGRMNHSEINALPESFYMMKSLIQCSFVVDKIKSSNNPPIQENNPEKLCWRHAS